MVLLEKMQSDAFADDKDASSASLKENVQKPAKKKFSNTVFAAKMRDRKREEKLKSLNPEEVVGSCKSVSVDVTRIPPKTVPKVINEVERKVRRKKKSQWKLGIMKKKKKPAKTPEKNSKEKTDVENASDKNTSEKDKIENDNVSDKIVATKDNVSEKNITEKENASDKTIDKTKKNLINKEKIVDKEESKPAENKKENQRRSLRSGPSSLADEKMNTSSLENVDAIEEESCRRTIPFVGKLNTKAARAAYAEKIISEVEPVQEETVATDNKKTDSPEENEISNTLITNETTINTEETNKTGETKDFKKLKKSKNAKKNQDKIKDSEKDLIEKESSDSPEGEVTKEVENCARTLPFRSNHPDRIHKNIVGAPDRPIVLDEFSDLGEKNSASKVVQTEDHPPSKEPKKIKVNNASEKESASSKKVRSSISNGDENLDSSSKNVASKLDSSNNSKSKSKDLNLKAKKRKSDSSTIESADTSLNASTTDSVTIVNHSSKNKKESLGNKTSDKVKDVSTVNANEANADSSKNTSMKAVEMTNNNAVSMDVDEANNDSEESGCSRTRPYLGNRKTNKLTILLNSSSQEKDANAAVESATDGLDTSSLHEPIVNKPLLADGEKLIEKTKKSTSKNIPANQKDEPTNLLCDSSVPSSSTSPKFDSPINNGEWKFKRKRQMNSESDAQLEVHSAKKVRRKSSSSLSAATEKQSCSLPVSPSRTICSLLSINCTKHPDQHNHSSESKIQDCSKKIVVVLTKLENMKDPQISEYLLKTESASSSNESSPDAKSDEKKKLNTEKPTQVSPAVKKTLVVDETMSNKVQNEEIPQDQPEISTHNEIKSTSNSILKTPQTSKRISIDSVESNDSLNLPQRRRKRTVNYLESDSDEEVSHPVQLRSRTLTESKNCESYDDVPLAVQLRFKQSTGVSHLRERPKRSNVSIVERDEDDMEVAEFSRQGSLRTQDEHSLNYGEESDQEVSAATYKMRLRNRDEQHSDREVSSAVRVTRAKSRAAGIVMDEALDINVREKVRPKSVLEKKIGKPKLQARSKTPCLGLLSQGFAEQSLVADEISKDDQVSNIETNQEKEKVVTENPPTLESKTPPTTPSKTSDAVSSIKKSKNAIDSVTSETPKKLLETPNRRDRSVSGSRSDTSSKSIKGPRSNLFGKIPVSEPSLSTPSSSSTKAIKLKDLKVQLIRLETIYVDYQDLTASEFEILMTKYTNRLTNSKFASDWRTPINYHRPALSTVQPIDNSDCVSDPDIQDDVQAIIEVTKDTDDYHLSIVSEKRVESPKKTHLSTEHHPVSSPQVQLHEQAQFHELQKLLEPVVIMQEGEIISELAGSTEINVNSGVQNQIGRTVDTECGMEKQKEKTDNQKQSVRSKDSSASSNVSTTKSNEKQKGPSKKVKKKMMKSSTSNECSVCKLVFENKDVLYDHLNNHSQKELQLAYKRISHEMNLEPGLIEELDTDLLSKNAEERAKSIRSIVCSSNRSSIDIEEVTVDDSSGTDTTAAQQLVSNPSIAANYVTPESVAAIGTVPQQPIMICSCHAHETAGQDLQIEMVLLCKSCNVIFRRRDCFEVHFRTSPECRQKRQLHEVTKTPKLFCSGCPAILNTLMDMRTHLEMHAKQNCQGTVTFVCNICKVAFFGVGGIFYSHWFHHTKAPNFVASKYSFPKLSVVSVLEDSNIVMTQSKSQEGFFYIAEHVCRQCKLPFSSEPDLQRHKAIPCQSTQQLTSRVEVPERNTQMIKLICDLCKKYYVNKGGFDRHCIERNHLKTPITKFSRVPVSETEQAIVCSLCRAMGKSIDEMKEHWKRVHSPILELYTCKTCNVVPSNDVANYTYENFVQHCRIAHKSEVITCLVYFVTARYVCNICKFGFETEKSMKDHEVIHEKAPAPFSANSTLPPNINTPVVNNILWVADKNLTPDGSQVAPVYVQYPAVNGPLNVPLPQNTVVLNSQNQQPMLNQSLSAAPNSTVGYVTVPGSNVIQGSSSNGPNHLLRNFLDSNVFRQIPVQQQQQQQQQTASRASPETITLDSRSNSPVANNEASSMSNAAATSDKSAAEAPAQRKSYMTMVNPDFETILGSDDNQSSGSNGTVLADKNKNSSNAAVGTDAQSNTDSLAPQPFEVVLVTDDISDNTIDDTPILDRTVEPEKSFEQQRQPAATPDSSNDGSSSTKSFLRVRSVAELQQIKIHLCPVCGLSFDTFQAFDQHQRVHDKDAGMPNVVAMEIGRDAPVQMIPPMQNNGTANDSPLLSQLRQKIMHSSNPPASPSNVNSRVNPSAIPNQSQGYYFASCNGNSDASQPSSVNYNTVNYTSVNRSQQQHQLPSVVRRPVQSNTAMPTMNYSTRGPLPSCPNAAPSAMSPSRTGAIQLPERNAMSTNTPTTKRPSGAATGIPQQSMMSYETSVEQRQGVSQTQHNATESSAGSSLVSSRTLPNILSRSQNQYQIKTYSRLQNDGSCGNSYSSTMSYSTQAQSQMQQQQQYQQQQMQMQQQQQQQQHQQQQQQQQPKIVSCKYQNCSFQSESFSVMRTHEKIHMGSQRHPVNQYVQQQQQQHYQMQQQQQQQSIQQQQRLPMKHVSVCQMPERTRHAMPTGRSASLNVKDLDKRVVCRLCNIYFANSTTLMDHNSSVHMQQNTNSQVCCYVCDYCARPQIYETELLLREHMNIAHGFSCEYCRKRYPTREDLHSHTLDAHSKTT